jgi:hypothetical protein
MGLRDAEMAAVTVTLKGAYAERLGEALEQLKAAGLHVTAADDERSVVEGTLPAALAHHLKDLDCVEYVRHVTSWTADYPAGDPRDVPSQSIETREDEQWTARHRKLGKRYP